MLGLSFLLASGAWAADEAADRAAIDKVVATLNTAPESPGLFTDDFGDNVVLVGLGVNRYRFPAAASSAPDAPSTIHLDAIHTCTSHEPWGELQPCPPAAPPGAAGPMRSSTFAVQSVRLLTPDVALVDAVNSRDVAGLSRKSPVLMVMHKEGGVWKIASIRVMAQARPAVVQ